MLFKSDWGGTLDLSGKFEGLGSGEDRIVSGKVTVVLPLN